METFLWTVGSFSCSVNSCIWHMFLQVRFHLFEKTPMFRSFAIYQNSWNDRTLAIMSTQMVRSPYLCLSLDDGVCRMTGICCFPWHENNIYIYIYILSHKWTPQATYPRRHHILLQFSFWTRRKMSLFKFQTYTFLSGGFGGARKVCLGHFAVSPKFNM